MKKLSPLWLLACLGACAPASATTRSPEECAAFLAALRSRDRATDTARYEERMPRLLNLPYVMQRLADTAASLTVDGPAARAVEMRMRVTAQGRPDQISVGRSSGSTALDAAAVWAMGFAEFAPAAVDRCPIPVWVTQPLRLIERPAPAAPSGVQGPPRR